MNAAGAQGRTPLMQLASGGYEPITDLKLTQALMEDGAKPNAQDAFGSTALMLAAARGKVAMVRYLLSHGADKTILNCHGKNAIALAKANKRWDVARILENRQMK